MLKTELKAFQTDDVGRVRTPAARREHLLNEFERRGLSSQKFAELASVKYPKFASWTRQRRFRRQGAESKVKSVDSVQWLSLNACPRQKSPMSDPLPLPPGSKRVARQPLSGS